MIALLIALILAALLFASLWYMHRLDEVHHGFIGIALMLLSGIWGGPLLFWSGVVLLADDDVQHVYEALCLLLHRPVPPDFTPIHKLGAYLLGRLYALVGHTP